MATLNLPVAGLDQAQLRAEDTARSLRETAAQALSIEQSAKRLSEAGHEQAGATEKSRVNMESISAGVEQAAQSMHELNRSQREVAETSRSLHQGAEATA